MFTNISVLIIASFAVRALGLCQQDLYAFHDCVGTFGDEYRSLWHAAISLSLTEACTQADSLFDQLKKCLAPLQQRRNCTHIDVAIMDDFNQTYRELKVDFGCSGYSNGTCSFIVAYAMGNCMIEYGRNVSDLSIPSETFCEALKTLHSKTMTCLESAASGVEDCNTSLENEKNNLEDLDAGFDTICGNSGASGSGTTTTPRSASGSGTTTTPRSAGGWRGTTTTPRSAGGWGRTTTTPQYDRICSIIIQNSIHVCMSEFHNNTSTLLNTMGSGDAITSEVLKTICVAYQTAHGKAAKCLDRVPADNQACATDLKLQKDAVAQSAAWLHKTCGESTDSCGPFLLSSCTSGLMNKESWDNKEVACRMFHSAMKCIDGHKAQCGSDVVDNLVKNSEIPFKTLRQICPSDTSSGSSLYSVFYVTFFCLILTGVIW